jgi:hypothetical protein
MTRILCCCLLITVFLTARAQQNRFIYIQTENKQAFYVKLEKKVFSSAASGYVIIPQLKDGSYNLSVGFPKNEWPEQVINYKVDKKDAGFMLKNFGEKGWGLFNLQTLEVLMAGTVAGTNPTITENKKDEFSTILSNAVNDSSIRKVEVVRPTEKKEEPRAPVIADPKKEPVVVKAAPAGVSRLLYLNGREGVQMIFTDINNGKTDTIRVLIPAEKETPQVAPPVKEDVAKAEPSVKKEEPKAPAKEPVAETKEKFIDIELPNPNTKPESKPALPKEPAPVPVIAEKPKQPVAEPQVTKKVAMINSNCKSYAGEDDFLKLRKKMAAADNDDDMVAVARKVFKTKCYTVEQVKNLGVLFLKDEGRYKFFDAAYPFVSDSENFGTLISQLNDEYYINRFNAMIKH